MILICACEKYFFFVWIIEPMLFSSKGSYTYLPARSTRLSTDDFSSPISTWIERIQ